MPIEFRCGGCGRLLRTADDSAGKQAKCPECGTVMEVPPGGSAASGGGYGEPPGPGPEQAAPGSPFASTPLPAVDPENPYQASGVYSLGPGLTTEGQQLAAGRVEGPAVGLMITAGLSAVFILLAIVMNLLSIAGVRPFAQPHDELPMLISGGVGLVTNLFSLAVAAVIFFGAQKMKNLQSYGFAVAAAVVAMVPCLSPCCLLGLPIGIWALVVLTDPYVKTAFRS